MSNLSWKKNGGIFETDNRISVSSITADVLTLRQQYNGTFIVNGALNVYNDASFSSNIFTKNLRVADTLSVKRMVVEQSSFTNVDADISGNLRVTTGKIYGYHGLDLCGNLMLYDNILLKKDGTGNTIRCTLP
jgi:hypothetical protein